MLGERVCVCGGQVAGAWERPLCVPSAQLQPLEPFLNVWP